VQCETDKSKVRPNIYASVETLIEKSNCSDFHPLITTERVLNE